MEQEDTEAGLAEELADEDLYDEVEAPVKTGKKKKRKKVHLERREFKKQVIGYLDEGITKVSAILKDMKKKRYVIDGIPVNKGMILAIKSDWREEQPEEEETFSRQVLTSEKPEDEKSGILWDMYEKAKKDNDAALMKRIQNRILGEDTEAKSPQERLVDLALQGLQGNRNGGSDARRRDEEEELLHRRRMRAMELDDKLMQQRMDMLERAQTSGRSKVLSEDPNVAMAEVITPAITKGFEEVNDTVREVSGLPEKERVSKEDEKRVKEVEATIAKLRRAASNFMPCPRCDAVIPKKAVECAACELKFKSKESSEPAAPTQPAPSVPDEENAPQEEVPEVTEEEKKREAFLKEWLHPHDGKLARLKRKIEKRHDAVKVGSGVWNLLDDEESQKRLLYLKHFGVSELITKASEELTDEVANEYGADELLAFYGTDAAVNWLGKFFDKIGELAELEEVKLSDEDIRRINGEIEPYIS